ncbi:MAG: hypothetical protein IT375_18430 [Polyangiaceae bacterium]|nr:hypothetical protein [Polyangiaceae bacterium]
MRRCLCLPLLVALACSSERQPARQAPPPPPQRVDAPPPDAWTASRASAAQQSPAPLPDRFAVHGYSQGCVHPNCPPCAPTATCTQCMGPQCFIGDQAGPPHAPPSFAYPAPLEVCTNLVPGRRYVLWFEREVEAHKLVACAELP